jgi:hypothetical protein
MWSEAYGGYKCHIQEEQRIAVSLSILELMELDEGSMKEILTNGFVHIYVTLTAGVTTGVISDVSSKLMSFSEKPETIMFTFQCPPNTLYIPDLLQNLISTPLVINVLVEFSDSISCSRSSLTNIRERIIRTPVQFGYASVPIGAHDMDIVQSLLSDDKSTCIMLLDVDPPNLRLQIIEMLHRQKHLPFIRLHHDIDLGHLQDIALKYGKSVKEVLIKFLLQSGAIVVLPWSVNRDSSTARLSHPFANRKLYASPSLVYRFILDAEDMELISETSFTAELRVSSSGGLTASEYLRSPPPRELSLERTKS